MNSNTAFHRPWWKRLWQSIVPPMPDFYGMLESQADNLRETVSALVDYLQACDSELATRIHTLVDEGHSLRDATLKQLYSSFVTPIDREDIYVLAMSMDHILDYLKNTVREVEVLQVHTDEWMQRMAAELVEGADSMALGLARLRGGQAQDVARTVQTRGAERRVEDLYRDALQNMFQGEEYQQLTAGNEMPKIRDCLDFVISRIKHREVYRHLSNAADRLAHAGEALCDISIKYQ